MVLDDDGDAALSKRERCGDKMEMMKMVEEAGEGFRVWGSWLNVKKRREKVRVEIRGAEFK